MATQTTTFRIFDGVYRKTTEPVVTTTIRLFKAQHEQLIRDYDGNISVLIRMLVQNFLDGHNVTIQAEFNEMLEAAIQEEQKRIAQKYDFSEIEAEANARKNTAKV